MHTEADVYAEKVFNQDAGTTGPCVFVITKKEELAAVTVPWGLTKAGFSLAICSMEDGRMPLSLETMSRPGKVRAKIQH